MPHFDAMKEILGKTIQGVIVKQNANNEMPAIAVHLVFDDGTSYEIYSLIQMSFASGLADRDMEHVRRYLVPPMENVLDISLGEA